MARLRCALWPDHKRAELGREITEMRADLAWFAARGWEPAGGKALVTEWLRQILVDEVLGVVSVDPVVEARAVAPLVAGRGDSGNRIIVEKRWPS
jgi:hypothetical protein